MIPFLKDKKIVFLGAYLHGEGDINRCVYRQLNKIHNNVVEVNTIDNPQILSGRFKLGSGALGPVYLNINELLKLVDDLNNTILYSCAGPIPVCSKEDKKELRERFKNLYFLGSSFSDPEIFYQTTGKIHSNFDWFTTNDYPSYLKYKTLGCENIKFMHFGCDEDFFKPSPVTDKYKCDVAFFGSMKPYRVSIIKMLKESFNCKVYGPYWEQININDGYLCGQDYVDAINSAKIIIDLPETSTGFLEVKDRIMNCGACDAFVITQYMRYMEKLKLYYNTNIVGFKDTDDLKRQVNYYLEHEDERQMIADKLYVDKVSWSCLFTDLFNEIEQSLTGVQA